MLLAAQKREWQIFYFLPQQLMLDQGRPKGHGRVLTVYDNLDNWYSLGDSQLMDLQRLDVILMRQEPPFDSQFLSNTFILEAAERLGTLIINRPQSLRDCNEKSLPLNFHSVVHQSSLVLWLTTYAIFMPSIKTLFLNH